MNEKFLRRYLRQIGKSVLIGALALCWFGNIKAATSVSGTIAGQTWSAGNSPYVVTGDITVGTLTIQPGVTVQFAGNFLFSVGNKLTAIGTADAPIVFTPQNANVGWKGISFDFAGSASEMAFCTVQGANLGGIRIHSSQPNIHDCTIANNTSLGDPSRGAGIWTDTALTLSGCIIQNNFLQNAATATGAGIYSTAPLTVQNCTVSANQIIVNNSFSAAGAGAGILCTTNLILRNSQIVGNSVNGNYGTAFAGGVFADQLLATNCIISYNSTSNPRSFNKQQSFGAGIALNSGQLVNCTIANNTSTGSGTSFGGGLLSGASTLNPVLIVNSIFWQDTPDEIDGPVIVSYSDVRGGFSGTGNIAQNPIFASANDLEIVAGSPCVDAGNPASIYNDSCFPPSFGTARNDIGAGGGPLACAWNRTAAPATNAPAITAQPQSQAECLGQSVSLLVSASGSPPPTYQWYFNQAIMPGQTGSSLTLTNLQSSMAGSYSVIVSNSVGSVTSQPAQLTISDGCLDIHMYPGLSVSGLAGTTYVISYNTDPGNANGWIPLATNVLGSTGWFFTDRDSLSSPKRFYKVTRKP